jgi:hypothetical protein
MAFLAQPSRSSDRLLELEAAPQRAAGIGGDTIPAAAEQLPQRQA